MASNFGAAVVALIIFYCGYSLATALYNVFWHPLARFPGPRLRAAFHFVEYWHIYAGYSHREILKLHDEYGEVVRIRPDGLSFNTSKAWPDIFHAKENKAQLPKDREFFVDAPDTHTILHSPDAQHARIRKALSHAFSEAALREQEDLMTGYFEQLVSKLQKQIGGGNDVQDMTQWYNFTTFDIIADLCMSAPLNLLRDEKFNFWTQNIFNNIKLLRYTRVISGYPLLWWAFSAVSALVPAMRRARRDHLDFVVNMAEQRLHKKTDRKDFMSYILQNKSSCDDGGFQMTHDEIVMTAGVILMAGSETAASVLCGVTYQLVNNPATLQQAVREVRSAFKSADEISLVAVGQLPYLTAALEESLRVMPTVPGAFPRRTRPGGDVIAGHFVPGDMSVQMHHWSCNRSSRNFTSPEVFAPERWLRKPGAGATSTTTTPVAPYDEFAMDDRAAAQPFHIGPRNCIGKNLAWLTMRAVLARMLWHFDMELANQSRGWTDDMHAFILWDKPPLYVKLKNRLAVRNARDGKHFSGGAILGR